MYTGRKRRKITASGRTYASPAPPPPEPSHRATVAAPGEPRPTHPYACHFRGRRASDRREPGSRQALHQVPCLRVCRAAHDPPSSRDRRAAASPTRRRQGAGGAAGRRPTPGAAGRERRRRQLRAGEQAARRAPRARPEPASIYRADRRARPAPGPIPAVVPRARGAQALRWWYLPPIPLALLVAVRRLGLLGYSTFNKAVAKSNQHIDRETRAALTNRHGGCLSARPRCSCWAPTSAASEPARSDTIMLMRFDPKTHTRQPALHPPRHARHVPGHGQTKINEAIWGGALARPQDRQAVHRHPHQPHHDGELPGLSSAWSTPSAASTWTYRRPTSRTGRHARVALQEGHAPLQRQVRHALRAHPPRRQRLHAQAASRRSCRRSRRRSCGPATSSSCPGSASDFMSGVATDLTTNQILELAYLKWRVHRRHPSGDDGHARLIRPQSTSSCRRSDGAREYMIKKFLGELTRPAAAAGTEAGRRAEYSAVSRSAPRPARGRGPEPSGPCGGARPEASAASNSSSVIRPWATSTIEPTATRTMLCRKLPAVISKARPRRRRPSRATGPGSPRARSGDTGAPTA